MRDLSLIKAALGWYEMVSAAPALLKRWRIELDFHLSIEPALAVDSIEWGIRHNEIKQKIDFLVLLCKSDSARGDALKSLRACCGNHPVGTVTEESVSTTRWLVANGFSNSQVALMVGLAESTVCNIKARRFLSEQRRR